MCRAGLFVPLAAILGHGLAELAEQERQPADDVGPVQRGRPVPQPGQRVEMDKAFAQRGQVKADGQHAAARRGVRAGPQQEPEQRVLAGPRQFAAQQLAAEAAVVHLKPLAVLVSVPDTRAQQEDLTRPHLAPSGQGMVDGRAADGEGDLHEAVRVHRAVPPVEVAARVDRHGLGQVEQALAGAYRGGLGHLRTVTPPACPG
jgi:hypothetical protein